jgi:hypothetical protein
MVVEENMFNSPSDEDSDGEESEKESSMGEQLLGRLSLNLASTRHKPVLQRLRLT